MASYVRIEGTKNQLLGLSDIAELQIRPRTAGKVASGAWEVYAYATESVISEIQGRGTIISIVKSEAEIEAHIATLDDFIGVEAEDTGFA